MVKRKRQVHTREFKQQAVALANGSDRTLAAVAQGLGVPSQTLAYPFNLAGERPIWDGPLAARSDCPVHCSASSHAT